MLPIAVIAPSHSYDPAKLEAGLQLARDAGLTLTVLDGLHQPKRYFAAPDAIRREQLTLALREPEWSAVWAVRGGSGVARLLRDLPWETFPARPLIGFSDLTPLLNHLSATHGGVTVHGPVLHSLAATEPADRDALFDLLSGRPLAPLTGQAWTSGRATGRLVGGNLTLIASMCGTPWQLDARGALLFLEEIGEAPYRIDRTLQQLRDAGVLDGVAGVLLGTWEGCAAPNGASWSLDEVLREAFDDLGVPVLAGLPFGHGARNHPLPVGATATLDGDRLLLPALPPLLRAAAAS